MAMLRRTRAVAFVWMMYIRLLDVGVIISGQALAVETEAMELHKTSTTMLPPYTTTKLPPYSTSMMPPYGSGLLDPKRLAHAR